MLNIDYSKISDYDYPMIFVFGSNLSGIHGSGAAKCAFEKYGAPWGLGYGFSGLSFAIPTKDFNIETLSLDDISYYVQMFLEIAREYKGLDFYITPIGCGLAGYRREQILPLFGKLPDNCYLAETWLDPDTN